MITEDYVSFEIAKLLKEKGFDGECFAYHLEKDNILGEYGKTPHIASSIITYSILHDDVLLCPTHQMAMKWLREKRIYFSLVPFIENVEWPKDTWHINFYNSDGIIGGGFPVEGYENAVEAALKYSLENLI